MYKRKYIEDFLIYFISSFPTNVNELQTMWYGTNNSKEKKTTQDMEELSVSDSKECVPDRKRYLLRIKDMKEQFLVRKKIP